MLVTTIRDFLRRPGGSIPALDDLRGGEPLRQRRGGMEASSCAGCVAQLAQVPGNVFHQWGNCWQQDFYHVRCGFFPPSK